MVGVVNNIAHDKHIYGNEEDKQHSPQKPNTVQLMPVN